MPALPSLVGNGRTYTQAGGVCTEQTTQSSSVRKADLIPSWGDRIKAPDV